jgi:hypothetical protein
MHASDVRVEIITVKEAQEYLSRNEHNRPVSLALVNKYATDMVTGRWMLSTDMIGFDTAGRLIQGQHRMSAVVLADEWQPGIEVPMLVGHGFPPESFDVLDQGKMRSAAHVLGSHGMSNTHRIGTVARQMLFYDNFPGSIWNGSENITRVQVINWALEHREEIVASNPGHNPRHATFLNIVTWVGLHYLVNRDSSHEARWDEFQHGVFTGENLSPGHPALRLRNGTTLATWGLNGAQPRLGAYIKAWNAFVEERPIQNLIFRRNELPMPRTL